MEASTYELIRRRLNTQATDLRQRLDQLNLSRKETFGAVETQLIATDRITTSNNCIPRDMSPWETTSSSATMFTLGSERK